MVTPIPPIAGAAPITPIAAPGAATAPAAPGFGDALGRGLQQISAAEHRADALMTDVATGGSASVHEMMVATTEAGLATDVLVQVRDKALEAYHEVMRLQV
jgi:flagellar hook-basal body complex protein FliE